MSKIKKIVVAIVLLLLVTVLLLQIDDELTPDAVAMLESVKWQDSNDAYLYLLGIGAKLGEEPPEEGALVLAQIRKNEVNYRSSKPYAEWPEYDERPTIELPEHDSFCSTKDENCITTLFIESDIDLNQPLMTEVKSRYQTFLSLEGFTTMTEPHLFEPFVDFTFLVKANRLMSLSAINKAEKCCPEGAMNELYELVELQKKHATEADTLIGQMLAYALLNETIDVLSLLIEKYRLAGRPITLLGQRELSLERVINREFAFIFSGINSLELHQGIKLSPQWVRKALYKKNISANALVPAYKEVKRLSLLSQQDFAREASDEGAAKVSVMSWIRNPWGSYLHVFIGKPSLIDYVGRGFDVNSKITLFNGLLGKSLNSDVMGGILNPYYPDQYDATYNQNTKRVCFGGPLKMSGFMRCIITFKQLN